MASRMVTASVFFPALIAARILSTLTTPAKALRCEELLDTGLIVRDELGLLSGGHLTLLLRLERQRGLGVGLNHRQLLERGGVLGRIVDLTPHSLKRRIDGAHLLGERGLFFLLAGRDLRQRQREDAEGTKLPNSKLHGGVGTKGQKGGSSAYAEWRMPSGESRATTAELDVPSGIYQGAPCCGRYARDRVFAEVPSAAGTVPLNPPRTGESLDSEACVRYVYYRSGPTGWDGCVPTVDRAA